MSSNKGYYGISFPFRIGVKGGIVMSGTSAVNSAHIEEGIIQLLNTSIGERVMEFDTGVNISSALFEPNDESIIALIKYEILKALEAYEPRIELENDDIEIQSVEEGGRSYVQVTLTYRVVDFANVEHTISFKLGGADNGK